MMSWQSFNNELATHKWRAGNPTSWKFGSRDVKQVIFSPNEFFSSMQSLNQGEFYCVVITLFNEIYIYKRTNWSIEDEKRFVLQYAL